VDFFFILLVTSGSIDEISNHLAILSVFFFFFFLITYFSSTLNISLSILHYSVQIFFSSFFEKREWRGKRIGNKKKIAFVECYFAKEK
jgi:hypothetical protein